MTPQYIAEMLSEYAEQGGHYFSLHCNGYAEPGYDDPESGIIATGNWNSSGEWDSAENKYIDTDNTMPRIAAILEKIGVEIEWEDEWAECSECGKLIRTSPDSYGWTQSYWQNDCEILCQDCVLADPTDYLESLEGNEHSANTLDIDLSESGYVCVNDESFENGLYGGQSDSPSVIADDLRKRGITRFIFEIDNVGQFDMDFSVWIHESETDKLGKRSIESQGPDPAVAIQSALRDTNIKAIRVEKHALRDASLKTRQMEGRGIRIMKCNPDGTSDVKIVSPQDFIDGKALD